MLPVEQPIEHDWIYSQHGQGAEGALADHDDFDRLPYSPYLDF